jgi:hypothetical protein
MTSTDRWIEAKLEYCDDGNVNVAVFLAHPGGYDQLEVRNVASVEAAKALTRTHAQCQGITLEFVILRHLNRKRTPVS